MALTRDAGRRVRRHAVRALAAGVRRHRRDDVWVKDETGNVGGSHKGRHLVTILLHLRRGRGAAARRPVATVRWPSPRAATRRSPPPRWPRRAEWPLDVFVPTWAGAGGARAAGGARRADPPVPAPVDDPPGDPAVLRFREAVAAGAMPFSVQGPENALCLDGGRTIGWEMADAGAASTASSSRSAAGRSPPAPAGDSAPERPARRRADRRLRAAGAGLAAAPSVGPTIPRPTGPS